MREETRESQEVCPHQQEEEQMIKLSKRIATAGSLVLGMVAMLGLGASPRSPNPTRREGNSVRSLIRMGSRSTNP